MAKKNPVYQPDYPCQTDDEKVQAPLIEKENGNIKFRKNEFELALKHYQKCVFTINFLKDILAPRGLLTKYWAEIGGPVYSNMAQCHMILKDYENGANCASKVSIRSLWN